MNAINIQIDYHTVNLLYDVIIINDYLLCGRFYKRFDHGKS